MKMIKWLTACVLLMTGAAFAQSPTRICIPTGVGNGCITIGDGIVAGTTPLPVAAITLTPTTVTVIQPTATNLNGTEANSAAILSAVQGAVPAGTNTIGAVNIAPRVSGGLTVYTVNLVAGDNHAVVKNGAGQLYHISAFNNNAAANYLRLYNLGTGFNGCNSATGLVWSSIIPGATTGAGFIVSDISAGVAFSTGISICVTGAFGSTDTTSALTNTTINIGYN